MSSGSGWRRSTGMISARTSETGAWSETASPNCSGRSAISRMPGTRPTVETVIRRAPTPKPSWITSSDRKTASRLAKGSPIPM